MSVNLLRLVPTSTVLAFVVYCGWSVDGPESGAGKSAGQAVRLDPRLLAPPARSAPARDPFGCRPAPPPKKKHSASPAAPSKVVARSPDSKRIRQATVRRQTSLRLTGTALGQHRLAVINNRIYGEGERLRGAGGDGWVVNKVLPGRVLLQRNEQHMELKFSERRGPSPPKRARPPAPPRRTGS